jgi:hypothetical protein
VLNAKATGDNLYVLPTKRRIGKALTQSLRDVLLWIVKNLKSSKLHAVTDRKQ